MLRPDPHNKLPRILCTLVLPALPVVIVLPTQTAIIMGATLILPNTYWDIAVIIQNQLGLTMSCQSDSQRSDFHMTPQKFAGQVCQKAVYLCNPAAVWLPLI